MFNELKDKFTNALSSLGSGKPNNDTTWKLLKELWDKAENKSNYCQKQWGYWGGELANKLTMTAYFPDQTKSNANVIKPIVETIIKNVLDAQFTVAVVPDLNSFYDLQAIKDARAIADIFNDEIHNIFKVNDMESILEQVARSGNLCGYGSSQVDWSTKFRPDGEIKIYHRESDKIRWNKGAKHNKITLIGFEDEISVSEAKDLYGRNEDKTFNEDICRQIEEISETNVSKSGNNPTGAVINYVNTDNQTAGREFVDGGTGGIQAGRSVKLVHLYLLDDSVYAPEQKDDNETTAEKQELIKAYPNGRHVIFSVNEQKKLILLDEPLIETFKNLGNIDVFNPTYYKDLSGKSTIDDLIPIQDRINGLCAKYREKIQNDLDITLVDSDFGMGDSAIVRSGVVRVENFNEARKPIGEPMSNNAIEKAMQILEAISKLIEFAYQEARVNETMLYGARQTGTTSGEQVEMLQESPMSDIRAQQRNFKNWIVGVAEKCLLFIQNNYTSQRLIQLSTGIDGATMAKIDTNGQGQRQIELYKEAEGAVTLIKTLNMNNDLKFKIECTGGTEIPRSRKENEKVIDELMVNPAISALIQQQNFDLLELIFASKDIPNRRAIMTLLRRQGDEANKKAQSQSFTIKDLIMNPVAGKNAADILNALSKGGFTSDISLLLKQIGLSGKIDDATTTPIKDLSSKADLLDVLATTTGKISDIPQKDQNGREVAAQIIDNKTGSAGI